MTVFLNLILILNVDWQWLSAQPAVEERGCVRHLRFEQPLIVVMNGKTSQGMIFKPQET